jgi:hypothetical protein
MATTMSSDEQITTAVPTTMMTTIPTEAPTTAFPTKKPTAGPTLFPTFVNEETLLSLNQSSLGFSSQIYPSTSTAWILPGGWTAPTATESEFSELHAINTSEKVKQWEVRVNI